MNFNDFYHKHFVQPNQEMEKLNDGKVTIYCPNKDTHIFIKCMHNKRNRKIKIFRGFNHLCTCHINAWCTISMGLDINNSDMIMELSRAANGRKVFLMNDGDNLLKKGKVGKLKDICIATMYKYKGEDILRDPSQVPPRLVKNLKNHEGCVLPFCIFTKLSKCTIRCTIEDHLCDLEIEGPNQYPAPWVFRPLAGW